MGVLQSIPLCSRGKAKSCEVPPLELDGNNNDPNMVVSNQPCTIAGLLEGPDATSTPRRRLGSSSDDEFGSEDLEIPTGFENPHSSQFNEAVVDDVDEDNIGPVVDQVVGDSDEEGDSGLESTTERHLDAFRKQHNLDVMRRQTMTPPPHPDDEGCFEDQFDDINYEDEDDETINVEDADSRDLSSSDDPLERPPEPTIPDEVPKLLSSSGSDSSPPWSPEENGNNPYFGKTDATTNAISNILLEIVGDRPHNDHQTSVVISR